MKINIEGQWRTINTGGIYINIEDKNLIQYNTWESGNTTPSNYQEYKPSTNSNINLLLTTELDPYLKSGVCWNYSPINSALTTAYGFNPTILTYDDSYDYRFSVWMKRTSGNSYNNHAFRVGFRIYNNDDPTYSYEYLKSVTSSASDRNLGIYINYENFNTYLPIGDWVFCNIILRKFGTTQTTNSVDSGYWINGTKIGIGNAYCDVTPSLSGSTKITVIVYMNNSIGDTEMLAIYPRLDKLDGTEPSISTLLSNEGNWRKINDMKINVGDDWKNTI